MVKDDLYITAPSFFRCPISLEVMKSPVSLCTGVTYDRASIQRWLDSGNNTCPATMQVLQTKDLIPNHTLQRLIQIWSDSVGFSRTNSSLVTRDQARHLVQQIIIMSAKDVQQEENHLYFDEQQICKLNSCAKESDENCRFLLSVGEEQLMPSLFALLGKNIKNVHCACKAMELTVLLLGQCNSQSIFISRIELGNEFCCSMMFYMRQGSKQLRISVARLLELTFSLGLKDKFLIAQNLGIYSELLNSQEPDDMEACLSCLVSLATPRRNRAILAKANAVELLSKALSRKDLSISLTEKMLKLLEMVSSCKEGRAEICEHERCVEAIVKKILKVSNVATEHAVTIVWSLCCLFRDEKAQAAVAKSNGMAKVLLLMQSNCSAAVRQMCSDLLKIFRVNSRNNFFCLSTYDTKTTHIMPF